MTASATGYAHQLSDIKIASSDPNIKHFKLLLQNSNDTTTSRKNTPNKRKLGENDFVIRQNFTRKRQFSLQSTL